MKKLKDLMTRPVQTAYPEMTVQEVSRQMRAYDIGAMPVTEQDRLIGIITDRDIVLCCTAEGADPMKIRARELMTRTVHWCYEDQDIGTAAELMQEHKIRRIPILNRGQRLVGIFSMGRLAEEREYEALAGRTLRHVSMPVSSPVSSHTMMDHV